MRAYKPEASEGRDRLLVRINQARAIWSAKQAAARESRPFCSVIVPPVRTIADPGKLVGQQRTKQLAVALRFVGSVAPGEIQHLVNVENLVTALTGSVLRSVSRRGIKPGPGNSSQRAAGLGLVGDRMNSHPGRHPVKQRHIATLENQPQLLAVHPAGLVKTMIEADEHRFAVPHRAMNVLLDRRRAPGRKPSSAETTLPGPSQPAKRSKKCTPCSMKIPPLLDRSQNQCPGPRFSSEA